ncbi:hypothetical protein ACJMK2_011293 [Sinanodonta woodiana]|uniref:Uncharacterized protein n=1 Tax=Sinanodonta woodiana TaxID=1069815 RepID=A0ABD3V4Q3_SINWO
MEQCRGCGLFFKRLSSHINHCKGQQDHNKPSISTDMNSKEESETGEICLKCQRSFKRLASHLPFCKGINSADTSLIHAEFRQKEECRAETYPKNLTSHSSHCKEESKEEVFSKRDDGLKQDGAFLGKVSKLHTESSGKGASYAETCQGCGLTFKRLGSHLPYCKGTFSSNVPLFQAEGQQAGGSRLETCPKCYKSFKNLASHSSHCKGVSKEETFSKSDDGLQRYGTFISKVSKSHTEFGGKGVSYEETCQGCGLTFKRLASHLPYCKGTYSSAAPLFQAEGQQAGGSRLETCPKCYKSFKNLASHSSHCKGVSKEETFSKSDDGLQRDGTFIGKVSKLRTESSGKGASHAETCQGCGLTFKRLASHLPYCKGTVSEHVSQTHAELQQEVRSREEMCPKCYIFFKNLGTHFSHCKGVSKDKSFSKSDDGLQRNGKLKEENHPNRSLNYKSPISQLREMRDTEIARGSESDFINDLRISFLEELNVCGTPFQWSIFSAGSYYDRTKTANIAGDYDFILFPDIKCKADFCTEAATLGYCKVTVCKDEPLFAEMKKLNLIKEHDYLSPGQIKEYAFEKFRRIIEDPSFRQSRRIHRLFRSPSSPAFTISYDAGSGIHFTVDLVPGVYFEGWPECDGIKNWHPKWNTKQDIASLKQEYFCVAREHPRVDEVPGGQMLWRESFSHTEKLLWKHADGARDPPTCRKPVLKALKLLLSECISENTHIKHLSTFHLRTFMLHEFDNFPRDKDWDKRDMNRCLYETKKNLRNVLEDKVLMNYFVLGNNVLQDVPETETAVFMAYLNQSLSPKKAQKK